MLFYRVKRLLDCKRSYQERSEEATRRMFKERYGHENLSHVYMNNPFCLPEQNGLRKTILKEKMKHMSANEVIHCGIVNKEWRDASRSQVVWKELLERESFKLELVKFVTNFKPQKRQYLVDYWHTKDHMLFLRREHLHNFELECDIDVCPRETEEDNE